MALSPRGHRAHSTASATPPDALLSKLSHVPPDVGECSLLLRSPTIPLYANTTGSCKYDFNYSRVSCHVVWSSDLATPSPHSQYVWACKHLFVHFTIAKWLKLSVLSGCQAEILRKPSPELPWTKIKILVSVLAVVIDCQWKSRVELLRLQDVFR